MTATVKHWAWNMLLSQQHFRPLNFATAPGHQILAAAGKKILRPGGKAATEQLFAWANF